MGELCNESFNGKLRDESLNGEIFYILKEAQIMIERWLREYKVYGEIKLNDQVVIDLFRKTYDTPYINFKHLGLTGVTFYALWVHGWNWVNPTTRQTVLREDEFNLDLQWKPKLTSLDGVWFRLCYPHNWQWQGGNATVDELRLIVNYHSSVL